MATAPGSGAEVMCQRQGGLQPEDVSSHLGEPSHRSGGGGLAHKVLAGTVRAIFPISGGGVVQPQCKYVMMKLQVTPESPCPAPVAPGLSALGSWKPSGQDVKATKSGCCGLRLLMCHLFVTNFASSSRPTNCLFHHLRLSSSRPARVS